MRNPFNYSHTQYTPVRSGGLCVYNIVIAGGFMMNLILPGISKTFGIIFNELEEKYNTSAALLSWIHSISIALALMPGEF